MKIKSKKYQAKWKGKGQISDKQFVLLAILLLESV